MKVLSVLEKGLAATINVAACALTVVETVILFVGVCARYVFHAPLIWSGELAEYLFLWLAMLSVAAAYYCGEHMRMTAVVDHLPAAWQRWLDKVVQLGCLVFLAALLVLSLKLMENQAPIHSPAIGLPMSWHYASVVFGILVMLFFGLTRLIRETSWRDLIRLAIVAALFGLGLWAVRDIFAQLGQWNLLVFFVGMMVVTLIMGVPIGFAFGLASVAYVVFATDLPSLILVMRISTGMTEMILLAVPLFIFLGLLIDLSGMASAMIGFLTTVLGNVRGGLSYVLVGAIYLVSGISGAKAADMAAVVPILFPEMIRRGTPKGELVALLAATGAQTEIVPPALVLIILGSVTGVSVAGLFAGGTLVSLLLLAMLCVHIGYKARHLPAFETHEPRAGIRDIMRTFLVALPALSLLVLIRYSVVEGIATATEVSTIGIVYAFIIGIIFYRKIDWRKLGPILVNTSVLSGAVLFILGAATAMGWAITESGFSQQLADMMSHIPGGAATFIAVSIVFFILLGSILEGIPALVLFAPLLFPVAAELGVNEIHYAMIVILSLGLGLFSPPLGVGYYMACAISKINPNEGLRPIWGYMAVLAVGVIIVALFPWLSTALVPTK